MALSWATLIAGALLVLGLPVAVVSLNRWKHNTGWWLLIAVVTFIIVGNFAATV